MIRDFAKPRQCGTFLCLYVFNSIQAYLETFCKLNRPLLPVLVEIRIYPAITEIFVAISWRLAYVLSVRNLRQLLLLFFSFTKSLLFIFSSSQTQSAERDRWINLSLEASNEVKKKNMFFLFGMWGWWCVQGGLCVVFRVALDVM